MPKRSRASTARSSKNGRAAAQELESDVESDGGSIEGETMASSAQLHDDLEDDPFFAETADEKRARMAKDYLQKLDQTISGEVDAAEIDDEIIAHRLRQETAEASGRLKRKVADQFKEYDFGKADVRRGHKGAATCVSCSRDDAVVVTGAKDGTVMKWDIVSETKQRIFPSSKKFGPSIMTTAVSDDGNLIAMAGQASKIHVYDSRAGKLLDDLSGHKGLISGVAFRRNSHELFSGCFDRTGKVWNLDEMAYVESLFGHYSEITSMDAMHGERALSCGMDRTVRLWKIPEETQLVFRGHHAAIDCVSMVNEECFVSGSQDGALSLWSTKKKKPLSVIKAAHGLRDTGDANWVSSVAAYRYGDIFASGSCDGVVRLWNWEHASPKAFKSAEIPMEGFINDMCFSLSGKYLFAATGQEHKFGRWFKAPRGVNGLGIVRLPTKSQNN